MYDYLHLGKPKSTHAGIYDICLSFPKKAATAQAILLPASSFMGLNGNLGLFESSN